MTALESLKQIEKEYVFLAVIIRGLPSLNAINFDFVRAR